MTKIKLSLPSGSEIEKTVISYFNNGGNYLVLDAESVGSMGLPIILVSKVTDKAEKIVDQTEWQQVKGYLKNIISGGQTSYLAIPESLSSDEVYYTQLTLPVASFDALKNNYVAPTAGTVADAPVSADTNTNDAIAAPTPVVGDASNAEKQVAANPEPIVTDQESAGTDPIAVSEASNVPLPAVEPMSAPGESAVTDMPPVNMSTEVPATDPIVDVPNPPSEEPATVPEIVEPVVEEPLVNEGLTAATDNVPVVETPELPVIEEAPVVETTDSSVQEESTAPVIETPVVAEPVVETSAIANTEPTGNAAPSGDITEIKQKFMKACEDLFDSLASLK